MNHRCAAVAVAVLSMLSWRAACAQPSGNDAPHAGPCANRDSIALEMRQTLDTEFAQWYPRCIDTLYGGFLSDLDEAWRPDGAQTKMIVTQARHIWSAANAERFYGTPRGFRAVAGHGIAFLHSHMWDTACGGYYDLVDRRGNPLSMYDDAVKSAYGNAFAIYGLAASFGTSGDSSTLRLAQQAFHWLEEHSYDPRYGGYFQFLSRNGTPFITGHRGTPPKDYNSLIHILECYTELYRVWKDPMLHDRLFSLFHLIRDTVIADRGYMKLYFDRNWTQAGVGTGYEFDHISFGHDVETAYLLLEASDVLGIRNDTTTLRIAKKLVDHAIAQGCDPVHGGLYDGASYVNGADIVTITKRTKEWWAQVEAVNAFLLMSDLFPNDGHNYYEHFCAQWKYCTTYLIDHEHGGWYWGGTDIVPENVHAPKASIWKGNYHTSRALINCITRLQSAGRP